MAPSTQLTPVEAHVLERHPEALRMIEELVDAGHLSAYRGDVRDVGGAPAST